MPPANPPDGLMIDAVGLTKRFGDTHALRGVALSAPAGTVLAVLGHNGAGKTTAVRILTTLSRPDAGQAHVAGFDVLRHPEEVRRRIGVTGQSATLDGLLTGRQNLVMVGELSRLTRRDAKQRANDLLAQFELVDAADRVVKGYSGGMRRRLDLAASLVRRPSVLFLDEPTTGLDPASRAGVWQIIREHVNEGVTVLLTTQYLDEADSLADNIVVIDHGLVVAEGTARELKAATGDALLEVTLAEAHPEAARALAPLVDGTVSESDRGRRLRARVGAVPGLATQVIRALDAAGVLVDDVQVHAPSLDDVFFALTGRAADGALLETEAPDADASAHDHSLTTNSTGASR